MRIESSVFVAGHRGLVGSAIVRRLNQSGFRNLVLPPREELDLTDQSAVRRFFHATRPQFVFLAAARVGGILANSQFPADFIRDNLSIELNVIDTAQKSGVEKLLMLGSSCIYPRLSPQPIREEYLLTGPLEPTNAPYAIAKIAGITLCASFARQYGSDFVSVMPTNIYGPGDNFDSLSSHVVPALIRKIHEATARGNDVVEIWGTGKALREFLYVDDLADACVFLMENYSSEVPINVGTGDEISIKDLAIEIARIVGFAGQFRFDPSKPDGTPRKLLDVSRLTAAGWKAKTGLEEGLRVTYEWYLNSIALTGSDGSQAASQRVIA